MLIYPQDERKNAEPLYRYYYRRFRHDILSGHLRSGEKLPSKRQFAHDNGVSIITVEQAYDQLVIEGYISSRPRVGFFVSALDYPRDKNQSEDTRQRSFTTHEASAPSLPPVRPTIETDKCPPRFPYDLATNHMPADLFPFSTWTRLMRSVMNDYPCELMTPPPGMGVPALREALARHLYRYRGIETTPQQIIVGAGSEYLHSLFVQLLGPRKRYAFEDPGYARIRAIYQSHGVHCSSIALDKAGISPLALESSRADIVHVSPSHHFPTGIVMPAARRSQLLTWATHESDRYILEDDYDSELRPQGAPVPALLSQAGAKERVIYLNTFSKTLASSLRISYGVLPLQLVERYHAQLDFLSCTVSTFEQYTLARFIDEGYFDRHIHRIARAGRSVRDIFLDAINASGLPLCVQAQEAGLHFLLSFTQDAVCESHRNKLETRFLDRAARHGIRLRSLASYYQGPQHDASTTFVINYASITPTQAPAVAQALVDAARESLTSASASGCGRVRRRQQILPPQHSRM